MMTMTCFHRCDEFGAHGFPIGCTHTITHLAHLDVGDDPVEWRLCTEHAAEAAASGITVQPILDILTEWIASGPGDGSDIESWVRGGLQLVGVEVGAERLDQMIDVAGDLADDGCSPKVIALAIIVGAEAPVPEPEPEGFDDGFDPDDPTSRPWSYDRNTRRR